MRTSRLFRILHTAKPDRLCIAGPSRCHHQLRALPSCCAFLHLHVSISPPDCHHQARAVTTVGQIEHTYVADKESASRAPLRRQIQVLLAHTDRGSLRRRRLLYTGIRPTTAASPGRHYGCVSTRVPDIDPSDCAGELKHLGSCFVQPSLTSLCVMRNEAHTGSCRSSHSPQGQHMFSQH